jgi:hypothetical protein
VMGIDRTGGIGDEQPVGVEELDDPTDGAVHRRGNCRDVGLGNRPAAPTQASTSRRLRRLAQRVLGNPMSGAADLRGRLRTG